MKTLCCEFFDVVIWRFGSFSRIGRLAKQFYSYLRTNSQWKTKTITKFAHKQFIDSLPDNHQNETALVYKFQQFGEVSFHFTCVYVTVNNTSRSSVPFFTIHVSQFKFNWLQKNKYFLRLQTLGNTQNYYHIHNQQQLNLTLGTQLVKKTGRWSGRAVLCTL